jgi:hypothetical protein
MLFDRIFLDTLMIIGVFGQYSKCLFTMLNTKWIDIASFFLLLRIDILI